MRKYLLMVDIDHPNQSEYMHPEEVGAFLWGKKISRFKFYQTDDEGLHEEIVIQTSDIEKINQQFSKIFYGDNPPAPVLKPLFDKPSLKTLYDGE